jgi:hypothetical protein
MRKLLVVAIASAALVALAAPLAMAGDRHGGGRGHSGKHWGHSHGHWRGGHWHGHWRGGHWRGHHGDWHGRYWGPRIAIGVSPFYWPYAYHSPSVVYAEPPAVYTEPPAAYSSSAELAAPSAVEREVVYPHGRYVLHGDGVSTAYRWVWIPSQ